MPRPAPWGFPDDGTTVARNRRKAFVLGAIPGAVGGAVAGVVVGLLASSVAGVVAAAVVVVAVAVAVWRLAPALVVAALDARPLPAGRAARLDNVVDGLCATMGLGPPALLVVVHRVPNAMAMGRSPSASVLVVTSGLLDTLDLVALESVVAHELVHVKRGEATVSGAAVVSAALVSWIVPRPADLVHRWVGRGRELAADRRAAATVRYPPGLEAALVTMSGEPNGHEAWPPGRGRMAAATRWLWIDPMVGIRGAVDLEGNLDATEVRAAALAEW